MGVLLGVQYSSNTLGNRRCTSAAVAGITFVFISVRRLRVPLLIAHHFWLHTNGSMNESPKHDFFCSVMEYSVLISMLSCGHFRHPQRRSVMGQLAPARRSYDT